MYYVRFLKSPTALGATKHVLTLKALVVVTTDLGEVNCPQDIELAACLVVDPRSAQKPLVKQSLLWTAGSHALSVKLDIPRASIPPRANLYLRVYQTTDVSTNVQERGKDVVLTLPHIIGGCSAPLNLDDGISNTNLLTLRSLPYIDGPHLSLWEDMGPSIDRHVWDAGMAMTALMSGILSPSAKAFSSVCQPEFMGLICTGDHLRVIELGAGVGLVGLSLAHLRSVFASQSGTGTSRTSVILTDVESARPIAKRNISHMLATSKSTQGRGTVVSFTALDWADPLPAEIVDQNFDLVLVSDCTYNPDSGPALVKTLLDLTKRSPGILIVVASKTRHASEHVFWERMAQAGFQQGEHRQILLPQSPLEEGLEDAEVANVHIFKMQ